jgi:hypothetical protein
MIWPGHVARIRERRKKVYTGFRWGNLRERDQWVYPGIDVEDNIKVKLQDVGGGEMDLSIWLRIGTGGGHL